MARIKRHDPAADVAARADQIVARWSTDQLLACAYTMLVENMRAKDRNSNLTLAVIRLRAAEIEAAQALATKREAYR